MRVAEPWSSIRNDATDCWEIRNTEGRLIAFVPQGDRSDEVLEQLRVRDMIVAAPGLVAAAAWHLKRPSPDTKDFLSRQLRLATGGHA